MNDSDDECRECGRLRSEHHAFVPITKPAGCICDIYDWGDPTNIPTPCATYTPERDGERLDKLCLVCEHPEECHPKAAAP